MTAEFLYALEMALVNRNSISECERLIRIYEREKTRAFGCKHIPYNTVLFIKNNLSIEEFLEHLELKINYFRIKKEAIIEAARISSFIKELKVLDETEVGLNTNQLAIKYTLFVLQDGLKQVALWQDKPSFRRRLVEDCIQLLKQI